MAFFMESIYFLIGLSLFLLPSIFASIIVFPKEPCLLLMSRSRTVSALLFLLPAIFQASFAPGTLLAVRGICTALLQHHISDEPIYFFLSDFFTLQLLQQYKEFNLQNTK